MQQIGQIAFISKITNIWVFCPNFWLGYRPYLQSASIDNDPSNSNNSGSRLYHLRSFISRMVRANMDTSSMPTRIFTHIHILQKCIYRNSSTSCTRRATTSGIATNATGTSTISSQHTYALTRINCFLIRFVVLFSVILFESWYCYENSGSNSTTTNDGST